jgi:aspartyl-tRNA(Asn)/glutamyl-tRNA(Gln) amidotransferase subunit B
MLDHPSEKLPLQVAEELSLLSASASGEEGGLTQWCREAIDALPGEAQVVRDGNVNVLNKIVGRVMKISGGRANAQEARKVLQDLLSA